MAYAALFERPMVRSVDVVLALTEVEADHIKSFAGREATDVVPNGVREPAPNPSGTTFRQALGLPRDGKLALFVGRLDVAHKGLDRLVTALKEAPSWRLALVGPDFRENERLLRSMAEREGVSRQILFLGSRRAEELDAAYAAADLFVLASRWEGLPMSLLEALSVGTPALVSREVERLVGVASNGAGWVAAPDEFGQLLERLTDLPSDAWAQRSSAALSMARQFGWDGVAAKCERAYREAVETSERRRAGRRLWSR
jgi:glycosyltransferase involved in cell wall biosynthesis